MKTFLNISDQVRDALEANIPVVALESTIISHGMPFPANIETANEVETLIAQYGVMPATIAIIKGKICVGLNDEQMYLMATAQQQIVKASRRDLPMVLAEQLNASTTVAATMICARLAGIDVFVTGGTGGVHRHADKTFDISADLQELAQTNVIVVSAGAKAILDLPLTMEYLETLGVPVLGYQTDEFPAFYTRTSGIPLNYRVDTPEEAAQIIRTKWTLGLKGGMLICNPVPEADAMPVGRVKRAINAALKQAKEHKITGKALTPFLLDTIKELTGGDSLTTNIALIKHNAEVGAQIAAALHAG